jgi:NADPH:quinone reductase-like Zn-dependent oxidoreductase
MMAFGPLCCFPPTTHDRDMRAITQKELGGPEVLFETELPRPKPRATEILVRVHAAGVNPTDWKHRENGGFLGEPPFVLGWDVSGVVAEVGFGVTLYRPGDEVFGMPWFPLAAGGYAEYVTAPARQFARKPSTVDHVHAAAVPLAALTAWQSLTETAPVGPGSRVLIHAAAGGVGHLAVQIAKSRGAHVIGTASAGKHEFVRSLGADEVIDYTVGDWSAELRDLDVVLDTIGGGYGERSLPTLRDGGSLVSLTENPTFESVRGIHTGFTLVEPDYRGLTAIAGLLESGALRVEIDSVFPLAAAADAHRRSKSGRAQGKIVLTAL